MDYSEPYKPPENESPPVFKISKTSWPSVAVMVVLAFAGTGIVIGMFLPAVRRVRPAAHRATCGNNMRQIALAFHNYEAANGHFPPAFVADKNGEPMHSWRVLILPYMEQNNIYEQYSMEEPWNGPNNIKLADLIGNVYRCPTHPVDDNDAATSYCLVTGEGTAFLGDHKSTFEDFKDGVSRTAILVEVNRNDIHWMEPKDLSVEQAIQMFAQTAKNQTPSNHPGIINVVKADASLETLNVATPPEELNKLFLASDEYLAAEAVAEKE